VRGDGAEYRAGAQPLHRVILIVEGNVQERALAFPIQKSRHGTDEPGVEAVGVDGNA